jgi:20S proteasome subunit alpha 1
MNWLEKRVEEIPHLAQPDTVQTAIMAMQHVLATDFKGSELEVGVVTEEGFKILSTDEIEEHLNAITERDA